MSYVDGFVLAVPKANKEKYREMAEHFAGIFRDNGALKTIEGWEDDVPEGEVTSFGMAVKRQPDEAVVFAWVLWPSKEVRDAGMAKMKEDMGETPPDMPFDGQRMIFGGFEVFVDA